MKHRWHEKIDHPKSPLELLITDFLAKVDEGTKLFEEKFGNRNILRLWRSGKIEHCGQTTNGIQHELHGVGCAIHLPSESVNFDYGSNKKINGFDVWRLYIYALDRPLVYELLRQENTKKEFKELVLLKTIKKYLHLMTYIYSTQLTHRNKFIL
ncbi:DUF6896 domain-containing protein [Pseudomonas helmanticensis]|uniref:DUF6896 domain-containing protein n=1 Tax=Pseudomonas helmanticensis TaxID=1471381 RepID=UPI0038123ED1